MPYLSLLSPHHIELKSRHQHAREEPHYWTVWEHKLHSQFHYSERMVFLTLFCVVTFVAVVGNVLTLYVVASR